MTDVAPPPPSGTLHAELRQASARGLLWPVSSACTRITSPFGRRIHPVTGKVSTHSGIDIAVPQCSVVRAPSTGRVKAVWTDNANGGGLSITVASGNGLRFGFAHLSQAFVSPGEDVREGDIIALSGGEPGTEGAGRSTGPHLHLTVRDMTSRTLIDPLSLFWRAWTREMEEKP